MQSNNPEKPIEDILNNLYVKAWSLIEDFTLIDIDDNDPVRIKIDEFVDAVRKSYETLKSDGYAAAWKELEKVSVGFIGLCRIRDRKLPNVNQDMSRECAEAYRALPDPEDAPSLDAALLSDVRIKCMEEAYQGKSRYSGPGKPLGSRAEF